MLNQIIFQAPAVVVNQHKHGKGIVFTGNQQQLQLIYVSHCFLQQIGSAFPVEIFMLNTFEAKQCDAIFHDEARPFPFNVSCKVLSLPDTHRKQYKSSTLEKVIFGRESIHEYSYKVLSLLQSSFEHVLFMDADCIAMTDPSTFFRSSEYVSQQALFWPDLYGADCTGIRKDALYPVYAATTARCGVWDALGLRYDANDLRFNQSMESGQMLINTRLHEDALHSVLQCINRVMWQWNLMGDKECFRLMFLAHSKTFHFVPEPPRRIGSVANAVFRPHVIGQAWKGQIVFIHRTKGLYDGANPWGYTLSMNQPWQCPYNTLHNGQTQRGHWATNIRQDVYSVEKFEHRDWYELFKQYHRDFDSARGRVLPAIEQPEVNLN